MHVCDLGVAQMTLGNIFFTCFRQLGGTYKKHVDACVKLHNLLKLAATELEVDMPISELTLGMFKYDASKKAKLRSKAGEARYLVPICVEMLQLCFPGLQLEFHCVNALNNCYAELYHWSPVSSPRARKLNPAHRYFSTDLSWTLLARSEGLYT